jgi:uncharacterized protein (TIGR03067 family)
MERHRPSADEKGILGDWALATRVDNGKAIIVVDGRNERPVSFRDLTVDIDDTIARNMFNVAINAPNGCALGWPYLMDPTKEPKRITLFAQEGGSETVATRQDILGVYKLEGDRLTIACRKGGPRPEKFRSKPGSGVTLLVLQRAKPQEANPTGLDTPASTQDPPVLTSEVDPASLPAGTAPPAPAAQVEAVNKETPAGIQRLDPAEEIRRLVPAATAMPAEDFVKIAHEGESPKAPLREASLTHLFLRMRPPPVKDPRRKAMDEEFMLTTGSGQVLPASTIEAEIYRPSSPGAKIAAAGVTPAGPVTLVHADRIRGVTCEVKGDTATGTVSYEVPKLYRGKFNYVAHRTSGAWQITELTMPAWGIHAVRNNHGTWVQK